MTSAKRFHRESNPTPRRLVTGGVRASTSAFTVGRCSTRVIGAFSFQHAQGDKPNVDNSGMLTLRERVKPSDESRPRLLTPDKTSYSHISLPGAPTPPPHPLHLPPSSLRPPWPSVLLSLVDQWCGSPKDTRGSKERCFHWII